MCDHCSVKSKCIIPSDYNCPCKNCIVKPMCSRVCVDFIMNENSYLDSLNPNSPHRYDIVDKELERRKL